MSSSSFGTRIALPALLAASSGLFAATDARAEIKLKISGTIAATVSNGQKTQVADELDFVLKGKEVEVYHNESSGPVLISKRSSAKANWFGPEIFSTKVLAGKLVLTGAAKTHTMTATVSTDGKSTCAAALAIQLNRGSTFYEVEWPGYGKLYLTAMEPVGVSCQLSTD